MKEILGLHLGSYINSHPELWELFSQTYEAGSHLKDHVESMGVTLGEGIMIPNDPRGVIESFNLMKGELIVGSILVRDTE